MAAACSGVYLKPGEIHFGGDGLLVRTLLGSCVAVTLWHPRHRIGGMCHVVFPSEPKGECDNRYMRCALGHFMDQVRSRGTAPRDYRVGLFGGGNMFPGIAPPGTLAVGARNVELAMSLLDKHGFRIHHQEVGGIAYRRIQLDLTCGAVEVRSTDVNPAAQRNIL